VERVGDVEVQGADLVGILGDGLARGAQHVVRVVAHQVTDAAEVVAPALGAQGAEGIEPDLRLVARAHAQLEHVDLFGDEGALAQVIEQVQERVEAVTPKARVRAIGLAAGQRRHEPAPERLLPRRQVLPERAVERPDDALARTAKLLEPEAAGRRVAVERRERGPQRRLEALRVDLAHVDGDLALGLRTAVGQIVAPHVDGLAEAAAVLDPVQRDPQACGIDRGVAHLLAERRDERPDIDRLPLPEVVELDQHDSKPVRLLQRFYAGPGGLSSGMATKLRPASCGRSTTKSGQLGAWADGAPAASSTGTPPAPRRRGARWKEARAGRATQPGDSPTG
jgi:hypothetical protein